METADAIIWETQRLLEDVNAIAAAQSNNCTWVVTAVLAHEWLKPLFRTILAS
jgi:hypothetical protein